jgi:hypothetical protein
VKEYHLFKTADRIVNTPREKIPIKGIFFFQGNFLDNRQMGQHMSEARRNVDKRPAETSRGNHVRGATPLLINLLTSGEILANRWPA